MSDNPAPSSPNRAARFRARRLAIANGESLRLAGDGTIERRTVTGEIAERWTTSDPGWAAVALRFGVRTSGLTVAPRGRDVPGRRPPA